MDFGKALKSGKEEDSILKKRNRPCSAGVGSSEIFIYIYTQIDGLFQSKFRILETGDILRISLK